MDLQEWAMRLAERLIPPGRGGHPVQLFVTASELSTLVAREQDDLLHDLQAAVARNPSYDPTRFERRQTQAWRQRRNPKEAPPGLPYVVAEVLVCRWRVEAGSLAFYEPLSEALGCRTTIAEDTYGQSFAPLWADLTWWLETVNEGDRGFPTWKSIPLRGARSVIGRPYTQILLRGEDWRDVDAFVEAIADDDALDFEIVDRERLAGALLVEFRRWATRERRLSPPLLAILASGRQSDLDTLSYLLLERLTGERRSGIARSAPTLPLVVTLDDWQDRTLRVAVVAPDTPRNVVIGEDFLALDAPRCPYPTAIPVTTDFLTEGATVQAASGEILQYVPRDAVALAVRSWDQWCSVNSVEPLERVYVLCRAELRPKVEALMDTPRAAEGVCGVPPGWVLLGPARLTPPGQRDDTLRGLSQRSSLVPTFAGGLRVQQGRVYIQGGPPDVVFPDDDRTRRVAVDGLVLTLDGTRLLRLADFALDVGRHTVTVDDTLRLSFDLVDPSWAGDHEPRAYRGSDGSFLAAGETPSVAGVVASPPTDRWLPLLPVTTEALVIGDEPLARRFAPNQAAWAHAFGLPFDSFDPLARMCYPQGIRPPFLPRLAAAHLEDQSWDVVALPGFEDIDITGADAFWTDTLHELLTAGVLRCAPGRADHLGMWGRLKAGPGS
jgi:hypothetical protein